MLVEYIDGHRDRFGVEPICTALTRAGTQIAPSTYYAAKSRPRSARAVRDEATTQVIKEVHGVNYGVYGVRKVHAELTRQGHPVARCTVHRLMKAAGLRGANRAKGPRTTISGTGPDTRPDLVQRAFTATAPDQLWVADITYCRTFTGWAYAAFVVDVYSRRVGGWQLSKNLRTDLALDALEMGLWTRRHAGHDTSGLIHHSDKGVQYVAVRYTQRLADAGAVASVGSTGDSYDNALAEAFNSLFKAELVRNKGPWKNIDDDLEIAVAEYVDWFNHRRLHGETGLVPPAEYEDSYYRQNPALATVRASVPSLHETRYGTLIHQRVTQARHASHRAHQARHERPDPRRPNLLKGCLKDSVHPPPPQAWNRRADHLHIKPHSAKSRSPVSTRRSPASTASPRQPPRT